jgi:hypothetical protein
MEKTPIGCVKLNFAGVARGNPSPAEVGGVSRNTSGVIIFVFAIHLGRSTNNVIERDELIKGLVVEGDSTITLRFPKSGGGRGLSHHHSGPHQTALWLQLEQGVSKLATILSVISCHISNQTFL